MEKIAFCVPSSATDRWRNCQVPEIKAVCQGLQCSGLMRMDIPCFLYFSIKKGVAVCRFFIDTVHQFKESPLCFEFLKIFF